MAGVPHQGVSQKIASEFSEIHINEAQLRRYTKINHPIRNNMRAPYANQKYFTIKRILLIVLMFTTVLVADNKMPQFYLQYATVEHSLKNDKGNFDELMKLVSINPKSAQFIARFWFSKAKRKCYNSNINTIDEGMKQIKPETSKKLRTKIEKEIRDEVNQCFYSVYYDHWDEINELIMNKYKLSISKNKTLK